MPDDRHADHDGGHQQGDPDELRGRRAGHPGQDRVELQPDEDEQHGVEQVGEDLPERHPAQPGGRGHDGRGLPTDVEAGRDGGEDLLGQRIGR
ncbi:hypothetical protein ACNTMW_33475 [Planosporangium sp. 12N6]|uniref:hypothetical protein n=1 Tax=Planosporangium spinosum TaxID=3402278 RepID=UPI003CF86976